MLENKTANNIVDRYHRIITGDQNQIEVGGNPNKIVTVTGTVADTWGDLDFADLRSGFLNNALSVWLAITMGGSTIVPLAPRKDTTAGLYFSFVGVQDDFSPDSGIVISYNHEGDLVTLVAIEDGTGSDYSTYANLATTELTVIYHPVN